MGAFLSDISEFLLKYRPVVYEQGRFVFRVGPGSLVGLAIVVAAAWLAIRAYRHAAPRGDRTIRWWLLALRGGVLLLLFFCLLRPALVISRTVPQENFLAVVLDDSRSMELPDFDETPRSDFAREAFDPEDGPIARALSERFKLRYFRFATDAGRVTGPADLTNSGTRTDMARGIDRAFSELGSLPLAGVVVVTDGADNAGSPLTETLARVRGRGVPVYTVGVGTQQFEKDVEISRIEAPRSVLRGSTVGADLTIRQRGFAGRQARLVVEADGRIVERRDITLPADGQTATVRAHFKAERAGPVRYRFSVEPGEGETITQNNVREAVVVVRDDRVRVLYFEGEPRFEMKFARRAVEDDENLRIVALEQTAENKYVRLGIEDPADLAGGFPRTREELYAYKAVILGSVPADRFTADQLQMIADFVSIRGGSLLLLGGRHALYEGGYAGTPLADLLPVEVPTGRAAADTSVIEVKAVPTPTGRIHAITRLDTEEEANRAHWNRLPPLTDVNRLGAPKAGATTLLEGRPPDRGPTVPLLVFQRYGRGRCLLFAAQDIWLWQMHADVPLEDTTHEDIWRQMLRWMVNDVPDQVRLDAISMQTAPGDAVEIVADVEDERFLGLNDTQVDAFLTAPDSSISIVPLDWDVRQDGVYRGRFTPTTEGLYEVHIEATRDSTYVGGAAGWLDSGDRNEEYFGAEMKRPLLERVAEDTGGRFYTTDQAAQMPKDIQYTEAGVTVHETLDLWDMPLILLFLLALLAVEWFLRRRRGLP